MHNYRLRFRDDNWWIVTSDHWYGPYAELETAKRLATATASRGEQQLRLRTKVIIHHKDGREEIVN